MLISCTSKDFISAVADLEKALAEQKFGVLWRLDMREKLAEKGVDFDGHFIILEVCNPHKGLRRHLRPMFKIGYFLPCKVVVYVEDGTTKLGVVRPSALGELVQGGISQDLIKRS